MRMKQKVFSMLALLLMAATGAMAQTETLLTTITATAKEQASYSTANVATVSFSYTANGSSGYLANWGWWGYGWSATVTAAEGYTITKCIFYDDANRTATDSKAPFVVETTEEDKTPRINETPIDGGNMWSKGIKKIEVYGYVTPTATTYSVTLAEGTEEADKWTVKVGEGEAQAFPVEGLDGGETVTATYSGEKKVKSVKAVKMAAGNAYLKWDADQKKLVATEIPTTATKVENADAGVEWQAGTYVVDGEVNISGTITLSGDVNLIIKDGATLTANKIIGNSQNLYIYGQAKKTGKLVVNCTNGDAIRELSTLEVHSAKVTATSSVNASGGIGEIDKFNVYGGLVDAKGTVATSYGIGLPMGSSMNIYGGEVKAEGTGDGDVWGYGIVCDNTKYPATVTVYGGQLWAGNANNKALKDITLTIDKSLGFNGEIETSPDNSTWNPTVGTPDAKYVRVGY